jgi:2,3-bisphosphoglycerate-dependent phosphoglycerate mutase
MASSTPTTSSNDEEMSESVLYLVRHGISEWNLLKKWQGQIDTNLAPEGQEQAVKRGNVFKQMGVNFDEAYTSDLKRASHTCQLLMNTCGNTKSVNPDPRLR